MGTPMPTLTIENGLTALLAGLGRNQNSPNLSEKRVTTAVRQTLRDTQAALRGKESLMLARARSTTKRATTRSA